MSGHNTVAREDCESSCASHAAEGGRDASAAGERVNAHTANAPIAAFTPASYVRDNVIGLAAFLLALASTVLILPALGVNSSGVLLVADILTLIALGAGFLDYRRKAAFYHELHHLTGQLRQACVLPSLIAEPPFLDGKIAYDTASRLAQLSAEETAALRLDKLLERGTRLVLRKIARVRTRQNRNLQLHSLPPTTPCPRAGRHARHPRRRPP